MKRTGRKITLQDLVDGFLFSLQAEGRAPETQKYYAKQLHVLLNFAAKQSWPNAVESLDAGYFRQFFSWIATRKLEYIAGNNCHRVRQGKTSAAWRYFRAVRRLFNWGVEEGLVENTPMKTIHFKTPPPPPIQPYSLDELKKLLAICDLDIGNGALFIGLRNKAMLLLFLDSGLRLSELASIQLIDIDLKQKMVRVFGKGRKTGICPFSAKTAKAIWQYLLERKNRAKNDSLWVTEEGMPFSPSGLSSWFVRLKERAHVNSPGRIHRLRHTSALQYLRGAKDSFLLQLFLRHEDLAMSRRYTQGLKQEEAIEAHRNGASPVEGLGLG